MASERTTRKRFAIAAGLLAFGAVGGLGAYLDLGVGWKYAPVASLAAPVLGVTLGVGVWRDSRWALVVCGAALSLLGLGLAGFGVVDLVLGLVTGESPLSGGAAYNQGLSDALVLVLGLGLLSMGILLARAKNVRSLLVLFGQA